MYIEIRAGEGGADAHRFASELVGAFVAYAGRQGWAVTVVGSGDSRTTVLQAEGAEHRWAWLAGTHRVQRVPSGDKHGRRHTSTATVAVLPDAPSGKTGFVVDQSDVRVDFFRGSGPGGQHRNKTSTAVRLTHAPTGIVVTRTSGRSQSTNLADAQEDLVSRLLALRNVEVVGQRSLQRRSQIVSGDRPVKVFTHNWMRGEVVCHMTGRVWPVRDFAQGRLGGK